MRQRTQITTTVVVDLCPACGLRSKQLQRLDVDERGTRERRLCFTNGCACRWSVLRSRT